MKTIHFCILVCFNLFNSLLGQSIELYSITESVYSRVTPNHTDFQNQFVNYDFVPKIKLTITPLKNKKVNLIGSYHEYETWVDFWIGTNDEKNLVSPEGIFPAGGGSRGTKYNLGLGIGYIQHFWKKRIRINPYLLNTFAYVKHLEGSPESTYGFVAPFKYNSYVYAIRGYYFNPSLNLPLYIKIYKGLYIVGELGYQFGIKPYAYSRIEWSKDGVRQPDARYETNGKSILISYGLSYIFNQKKKK